MKLLGITNHKLNKDKNGKTKPHLENNFIVLIHFNIFNNNYQFHIHFFLINHLLDITRCFTKISYSFKNF